MELQNLIDMTEAEAEALLNSDSEAQGIEQGAKDPETCQKPEVLINPGPVALSKMGHPTSKRPRHRTRYRKRQRLLPASHPRRQLSNHEVRYRNNLQAHRSQSTSRQNGLGRFGQNTTVHLSLENKLTV
ncbi:hypothetical protein DPMN_023599 [Dreissena polymorpha]|uniref:Uncharacterized protein n=1 Tax=Dreissena polymorpha TaxID=45954 RepID=A0A9D4RBI9_DREPO|nr:hypothetical protein DPMN_023599 [Dreissena polymorpha]